MKKSAKSPPTSANGENLYAISMEAVRSVPEGNNELCISRASSFSLPQLSLQADSSTPNSKLILDPSWTSPNSIRRLEISVPTAASDSTSKWKAGKSNTKVE